MRSKCWTIVTLLLIAGCASTPPISYYTLDMTPSGRATTEDGLDVEGIRTTEALARSQIQIQASPTRVDYYASHEWAGNIGELVGRKLAAEFGTENAKKPRLTLSGTLLECAQVDQADAAEAKMVMSIVIRDTHQPRRSTPLIKKTYTSSTKASAKSPSAVVEALSRCAEEIAAEIASDVSALKVGI